MRVEILYGRGKKLDSICSSDQSTMTQISIVYTKWHFSWKPQLPPSRQLERKNKYPVALLLRVQLVKNARAHLLCAWKVISTDPTTLARSKHWNQTTRSEWVSVQLKLSADGFLHFYFIPMAMQLLQRDSLGEFFKLCCRLRRETICRQLGTSI